MLRRDRYAHFEQGHLVLTDGGGEGSCSCGERCEFLVRTLLPDGGYEAYLEESKRKPPPDGWRVMTREEWVRRQMLMRGWVQDPRRNPKRGVSGFWKCLRAIFNP